jgi:acyl-CoA dehydrogenase
MMVRVKGAQMRSKIFNDDHGAFREVVRNFIAREVVPTFSDWEKQGHPPRDFYRRMGELGLLGIQAPTEFGGGGVDEFTYSLVMAQETARAGVTFGTQPAHSELILPYLMRYCSPEQKQRWLPDFCSGELMTAIAMTEPGTGSDLAGIVTRAELSADGSNYVLNGAKTFITGGALADLVLVVCRTSPPAADRRAGLSILCVESASAGFAVGAQLAKIGLKTTDTAELSFTDVEVPVQNLLGEDGNAFAYLASNLAQERLAVAISAHASAAAALEFATGYVTDRTVFGKPVASFQNTKFVLAECATEVAASQLMVERALSEHNEHALSEADAAIAKLFCTEVAGRVIDKCVQLHGGYGYVLEYPIARLYADTRVSRIYGGTSEVMKMIIAKELLK